MSFDADVAIVGAGPAGAAAALALAPACHVVLVDRAAEPLDRIGETLPGAARRLLTVLGAWDRFVAEGHAPCYARRSVWGSPEPIEQDGLFDPDGFGWRLDRRAFERGLRSEAQERGAELIAPAQTRAVRRESGGWIVTLDSKGELRARVVIDASGRSSRVLRGTAGRRLAVDRLLCAWTHLPLRAEPAQITYVEADPHGWWYTAPLPDGRRLLAFHCDSDDPVVRSLAGGGLIKRARSRRHLVEQLGDSGWEATGAARLCLASGARIGRAAGEGWIAAGDAALSFDPLSSQGLFNALYTGLAAADAARGWLGGDGSPAESYNARIDEIWNAYRRHLAIFYGAERRWLDAPFWSRRIGQAARLSGA